MAEELGILRFSVEMSGQLLQRLGPLPKNLNLRVKLPRLALD